MRFVALIGLLTLTSACADRTPDDDAPGNDVANQVEPPRQSIIRDEVLNEVSPSEEEVEAPLTLTVGFPEGGAELSPEAMLSLEEFVTDELVAGDEVFHLWGHSDSRGGEAPNRRAGQQRAEAVAEWLVERGIDADRLVIISLGADNPIAPNANLDGSDNEKGQAANRRVEILVGELPEEDDKIA
ncbi:OmpA family protein [Sphingomicrobium marinum]|uniref:OmpA family protein n=1 Tax=Sphingomicrobium marinum TaxID=1227950 RepID=UPI00223E9F46|nr:OmpA family protein [Sphingomicrobium marinum]